MRSRSSNGKLCFSAGLLLALACISCFVFSNREGTFSYGNYQRIRTGMTLAEVERLLGKPGTQIDESFVALTKVADKAALKPVISGDRYCRWENESSYIIVSLQNGVVAEKWYWEPSL